VCKTPTPWGGSFLSAIHLFSSESRWIIDKYNVALFAVVNNCSLLSNVFEDLGADMAFVIKGAHSFTLVICLLFGMNLKSTETFAQGVEVSTDLITEDVKESYRIVKGILEEEYDIRWYQADDNNGEGILLTECGDAVYVVKGPIRSEIVGWARSMIFAKRAFLDNNFTPDVWSRELELFEALGIEGIESYDPADEIEPTMPSFYVLADIINQRVQERAIVGLPKVFGPAECGGDLPSFILRTQPSGGNINLIPKVYYRYCEKTGTDPKNKRLCDHWLPPVRDGEDVQLGGVYIYEVAWPDKTSPVGAVDVDRYDEDGDIQFPR
jgi:hypothetical protein